MRQDGGWQCASNYVFAAEDDEVEDEEELAPEDSKPEEVIGEKGGADSLSAQEQASVLKLHKGIGHPPLAEFIRFMKAARVRSEVVRWAAKNFRCESCEARSRTKAVRPATIPKTFQPNKVIGVDLIYIPAVGGQQQVPALSILDWGTNYQMVELIPNKEPGTVWRTLWSCWARVFGLPEVVVCDAGKEFASEFVKTASANGIVIYQIGARAPWQNGKTERHGAHFKELLEKARAEMVVTEEAELRRLMQEVESVKNRFSNRSGFSPIQRQIGQWPRAPTEITSDEVIDPTLVAGALVDDVERIWEMRRLAQKAFVEHNARAAVSKALRARSRTSVEYQPGDFVYVYRVHRQRKRKVGGVVDIDHAKNKPTWVGPGTVVAPDGANLWITVWGELWKVAKEQCRLATNMEKHGVELVLRECKDLVEEYKKTSKRAGYKDITNEPFPEDEEGMLEDQPEHQDEDHAPRQVRFNDIAEEEGYSPSIAEDDPPAAEVRRASNSSRQTIEEPEFERSDVQSIGSGQSMESTDSGNTPQSQSAPQVPDH